MCTHLWHVQRLPQDLISVHPSFPLDVSSRAYIARCCSVTQRGNQQPLACMFQHVWAASGPGCYGEKMGITMWTSCDNKVGMRIHSSQAIFVLPFKSTHKLVSQSIKCINDRGHGSPSTEASIHHSWQLIFLITLRKVYSCVLFQKARSSHKKDREPHWCFPNLHRLWNATLKHSSEYQYHVPRSWGVLWTRDQNQSVSSWRRELFHDSRDELKIKDFPLHNSTVQSFITCLMQ